MVPQSLSSARWIRALLVLLSVCTVGCDPEVSRLSRPIVDGTVAPAGTYSAVGALAETIGGRYHAFCTGTLIAPRLVLTAGHCVQRHQQSVRFFLGNNLEGRSVPVCAGEIEPRYLAEWTENDLDGDRQHDIGIYYLSEAVDDVVPLLVATAEETASILAAKKTVRHILVGFGKTTPTDSTTTGTKVLGAAIVWMNAQTYFCLMPDETSGHESYVCEGDSGGPTVVDLKPLTGADRQVLAGVIVAGNGNCDGRAYAMRVDASAEWLRTRPALPPENAIVMCDEGCALVGSSRRIPAVSPLLLLALTILRRSRRARVESSAGSQRRC
jgi:hypothetical protein